jgi:uncharacterized glyoxalase superfamily protein PhnB
MAKGLWPVLNVDNVEKSVEFYNGIGVKAKVEAMEMPGMPSTTYGSIELTNDAGIILWNKHNVPPDQPEDTKAWVSGDLGKGVLLTIGVPNAQKAWASAQKIRAEVDTPLEPQPWGGHGFNVVDPDGYVVNVTDKFPGAPPKKATARRAPATKAKGAKGKGKAKPKRKGR